MPGPEPMRIRIRGVVYSDAVEAAAALGVTRDAVYRAIRDGDPDRVGLPRTSKGQDNSKALAAAHEAAKKPIFVAETWFPSAADLARTLGIDPSSVRYALKSGPRARANLEKRVRQAVGMF